MHAQGPRDEILERRVASAQRWLSAIYALDLSLRAERFLLAPEYAQELLPGGPRTGVLALEEDGDCWVGLYLDPRDRGDEGAIVEETSHLLCLAWHHAQERPVSRLILELQADVDRYAVARLRGGNALRHLGEFSWAPELAESERSRYALAHRTARRYCTRLQRRYPSRADVPALLSELRSFYRAGAQQKLRAGRA